MADPALRWHYHLGLALFLLGLAACSGDPGTGPVQVVWDRDGCERCRMVLSDRRHAAQVRGGPGGERARVYRFDDLGCAVLWLEQQAWKEEPATELWVTDHRTGQWIDARKAHYVTGQVTPMEYGLGAQAEPAPAALDFAGARAHIFDIERRFNIHGGNLEHFGH